jgi:hypothetical protein
VSGYTKTSAKDVIDYEIRMLNHCARRTLDVNTAELDDDQLAILEAFLLHFRILLEFFGRPNPRYVDNLYFQRPASYDRTPTQAQLRESGEIAERLEAQWGEKLNKYLAHPTVRRHLDKRSWPVDQMHDEMSRLIRVWRAAWSEQTPG